MRSQHVAGYGRTMEQHAHSHAHAHSLAHPHRHAHAHAHAHDHDEGALADLLDLDARVLHAYLTDVTGWVREHTGARTPRRIADLGAGTGTGTMALARRFPRAELVAVDTSPAMLERVRAKAFAEGLAHRVRTVQADLDTVTDAGTWPLDGPFDLVWAASSLHHLSDPPAGLARARQLLAPDGLLVAVEMDAFPRYLPDDVGVGEPGLEERLQSAVDATRGDMDPFPDWEPSLAGAGLELVARRTFATTASDSPALRRCAAAHLGRAAGAPGLDLGDDDRVALSVLLGDGPLGLARRGDLTVHGTRTAWIARRA